MRAYDKIMNGDDSEMRTALEAREYPTSGRLKDKRRPDDSLCLDEKGNSFPCFINLKSDGLQKRFLCNRGGCRGKRENTPDLRETLLGKRFGCNRGGCRGFKFKGKHDNLPHRPETNILL